MFYKQVFAKQKFKKYLLKQKKEKKMDKSYVNQ